MARNILTPGRLFGFTLSTLIFISDLAAQAPPITAPPTSVPAVQDSGSGQLYLLVLFALAGFGAAYFFWKKGKKNSASSSSSYENRYSGTYERENTESVDFDKEMEWFRKAKKSTAKNSPSRAKTRTNTTIKKKSASRNNVNIDTTEFQAKMRKAQFNSLPINSFLRLTESKSFQPLPVSNDPALLNAIEQVHEEFEQDEAIRELAVRILTAFKTANSVDALAQVALYDLSSNLRSKAVGTLTDFDHESVFETMLLACADPTREVRAAASRGLFRLSFDRVDAWKRIIETNDDFRMSQATRAATEAGFVKSTFDRLLHEDLKLAGEAFALVSLIVKSGETDEIFDAIKTHKDERVKFALLHILKVHSDEKTLPRLYELQKRSGFSADVAKKITETINTYDQVMA